MVGIRDGRGGRSSRYSSRLLSDDSDDGESRLLPDTGVVVVAVCPVVRGVVMPVLGLVGLRPVGLRPVGLRPVGLRPDASFQLGTPEVLVGE